VTLTCGVLRFSPGRFTIFPGRFTTVPTHARTAKKGVHAVTFSMNPYALGLLSMHDDYWDPFWAACDENEIVVCLHIGSGSDMIQTSPDAPMLTRVTCSCINIYPTAADLIWSPMMHKLPNLMFSLAEGGIGWIPYFLDRADNTYIHNVADLVDHPFYGEMPAIDSSVRSSRASSTMRTE